MCPSIAIFSASRRSCDYWKSREPRSGPRLGRPRLTRLRRHRVNTASDAELIDEASSGRAGVRMRISASPGARGRSFSAFSRSDESARQCERSSARGICGTPLEPLARRICYASCWEFAMPTDATSPFTPGVPVPTEFFVGRAAEVQKLREHIRRAAGGRLQVIFLTGERGIGKSSLAYLIRKEAERDTAALGIHVFLGGVATLEEMARRVFDRLVRESIGEPWHKRITEFLGPRVKQVGLPGILQVSFEAKAEELRKLVDDFAAPLRTLLERMEGEKKVLFLILDDINGLAESPEFANWLKSFVDAVATSGRPLPLCLLIVGLEERRQALIGNQPSLARVFDPIELRPWSNDESESFFQTAFKAAGIKINGEALDLLVEHTGGLPVMAHELGDAAFKKADKIVDETVAIDAVITAAEIVGRKHLQPQVFSAIRSERYRSILRKLAKDPVEFSFERAKAIKHLSKEEVRVFDNFLRRMSELGVIQRDPDRGQGAYRFCNHLHYTYFWLEGARTDTR